MISKERVKRAIHFQTPDRIPIHHSFLWGGISELGEPLMDVFRKYPSDFSGQHPENYSLDNDAARRYLNKCIWTDEWGCVWDFPGLGTEGHPVDGPLYKSWKGLKNLPMPVFRPPTVVPKDIDTRFVGEGIPGGRLFERMHFLRGFENLLMDIVDDSEEVYILRDKLLDWEIEHLEPLLELSYVDYFGYMDDWGSQQTLLIPPEVWRKIFKPAYKKIFSLVRDAGKEILFHSDGMIIDIIPDLIEMGVTMLNPQFSCMNQEQLASFKGKVCFVADIDRQNVLCFGTVEEVEKEVKSWIRALSSEKGGIIGRTEISPGIPLQNAETAYRTFFEFRF